MTARPLLRAALSAALLLASAGCGRAADDAAFGARVRAYLLAHPEVLEEAMKRLESQKAEREAAASAAAIRANLARLERDPGDFVANPKGRVTVVEFFDYKCPYCKTSADAVVRLIRDNPDVRFVFKEFPILTDVSRTAAADQVALIPKGRYLETFQKLMDAPDLDADKAGEIFRSEGLDPAAAAPAQKTAAEAHLKANRELAAVVGVEGTPAFIVGGQKIDGWQPEQIEAQLKAAREGKAPA